MIEFLKGQGVDSAVIGNIGEGSGVHLVKGGQSLEMEHQFREAPYTPVKKVMGVDFPADWQAMRERIDAAAEASRAKKERVKDWIRNRGDA